MISPLAYVDSAAKIGKNVTIQPFAFIEGNVEIGDDCIIMSGAKILHGTRMGKGNKVHHNAVLGAEPQDFHYTGENSMLIIGDNNDIRENVVVSRATHAGSATRIGNENYLMDGVHLCHDVQIGNHCVLGIKTTVADGMSDRRLHHSEQQRHSAPILPHWKLGTDSSWLPHIKGCAALYHHER